MLPFIRKYHIITIIYVIGIHKIIENKNTNIYYISALLQTKGLLSYPSMKIVIQSEVRGQGN